MKVALLSLFLFAGYVEAAKWSHAAVSSGGIAEVVTMLKKMLKTSQDDWKADKEAFEKFKTYCEENDEKKTEAIAEGKKTIGLLTNKIEEIQGTNGDLSVKVADLKALMEENEKARDDAKALREKENKAFEDEKKDLNTAMDQMDEAIRILSAVGADQTLSDSADHEKFMAKYKEKSLLSVQSSVKKALTAASFLLEPAQQKKFTAFVQAPFTGTYSAQSGQVVGILKSMKDTFKANLETAEATEKAAKKAYEKFKKNKEDEHADMKKSYDEKQDDLGTNDGDLSGKKKQLTETTKTLEEDEDFLGKLKVQCVDKTKEYEIRKKFALNEEIALNKAISILDNDVSNEKFGAVDATKFIQLSSKRHRSSPSGRTMAVQLLQNAVKAQRSSRVNQVLLLLQAGNPFTVVLKQIDNMVDMCKEEQKVDDEEKKWCEDTNQKNDDNLSDKKDELTDIRADISKLKADIGDAESGLKKDIADTEESLKTNLKNQGEQTDKRREENLEYQKDVHNMEDCINTIKKAEETLKEYYDALDNEQIGFLQISDDPDAPDTFEGDYKGQNEQAKKVLKLLGDLRKATVDENNSEHDAERKSQHDYEDSMADLTEAEEDLKESIVKLNKDLTSKEKELDAKFEEETVTEKEKIAIERYMEKIKPGCDFVLNKYDERKKARTAETKALNTAKDKLKGSPAFKSAQQKAKEDGFGDCKADCVKNEAGAKCKACLAGISVPGYCAGHKGAPGC